MTSAAEELLPCPFCGGEARVNERLGFYWVDCYECGASGPTTEKELAIAVWNNRADERSRYAELLGTPERAARTVRKFSPLACSYCAFESACGDCQDKDCLLNDYDALLEWLRGDA